MYQTDKDLPEKRTGNLVDVGLICVAAIILKSFWYPEAEIKQIEIYPISSGFNSPWVEGMMTF